MNVAFLDSRFFKQMPPPLEFFQKWRNLTSWNETLLPVYEWEGILFIATSSDDPQTVINTLLPLYEWNGVLFKGKRKSDAELVLDASFVLVKAQTSDMQALWQEWQNAPEDEAPEGLNLTASPRPQTPPVAPDEAPDGLTVQVSSAKISSEDDPFALMEKQKTKNQGEDTIFDSAGASVEEPAPVNEVKPELLEIDSQPSIKTSQRQTGSHWTESIFDRMNSHFPRSMILLVSEHTAMPWKWNEGFIPAEQSAPIDLKKPSPFKVVHRTNKPYHGSVPECELLTGFAKIWCKGVTPKNLSIAPVIVNEKLIGMLLAEGDSENFGENLLHFTEGMAKEISDQIKKSPQSLRAA
jgi:hypothetical protein